MSTAAGTPLVSYRKTKTGEWVAYGPVSWIVAGQQVEIAKKDGSVNVETVATVGRPFTVDGREMVYGYLSRDPQPAGAAKPAPAKAAKPAPAKPKKATQDLLLATDKQVALVQRLIAAGNWHDSDAGQGADPPTAAQLRKMSSREISELIDDLKGGY